MAVADSVPSPQSQDVKLSMIKFIIICFSILTVSLLQANVMENKSDCTRVNESKIEFDESTISMTQDRCVDSLGLDADGNYEYYYKYDIYRFANNDGALIVRSYSTEPDEAHFLGIETNGKRRMMEKVDFKSPIVKAAISYLIKSGKSELTWLDQSNTHDGYSKVPI